MADTERCDSCGRDEPPGAVVPLRRVYYTPGSWDTEERIEIVEEIERWCFSCRSSYPHEPVEDRPGSSA